MGSLNTLPATVTTDGLDEGPNGTPTVMLEGGQNVCFLVHGTKGTLYVTYPRPYTVPPHQPSWTASFNLTVPTAKTTYVLSVGSAANWHRLWILQPVKEFCAAHRQWAKCLDPG
jgi:hypothetical protein